jgi:hypothetical protein
VRTPSAGCAFCERSRCDPLEMRWIGLHLDGWLLQAFDLNNPAVGESVSNVGGVFDFFPSWKSRIFARGGVGLSMYSNNRPTGSNGNGLGWEVGGGYEIPLRGQLGLAPMVEYASSRFGDVAARVRWRRDDGIRWSSSRWKRSIISGAARSEGARGPEQVETALLTRQRPTRA